MSKKLGTLVVLFLLCRSLFAEEVEVCLARIPDSNTDQRSLSNPEGREQAYRYEIKVGDIVFHQNSTTTQCAKFQSGTRLLVIVQNFGKVEESFFLDLAKYETGACIWFKALYESWSVWGLNESKHICANHA